MSAPFTYEADWGPAEVSDWILDGEIPIQISRLADVAQDLARCAFHFEKKELLIEADMYLDGYSLARRVLNNVGELV